MRRSDCVIITLIQCQRTAVKRHEQVHGINMTKNKSKLYVKNVIVYYSIKYYRHVLWVLNQVGTTKQIKFFFTVSISNVGQNFNFRYLSKNW